MRLYRSTTFRAFIFVLLITSDSHAVCFEKARDGVKVDGDCQSEKATLFTKEEGLTVKFSSGSVTNEVLSTMTLNIGGCKVGKEGTTLAMTRGGSSMIVDGISLTLAVIGTVSKYSIRLKETGKDSETVYCHPKFTRVPGGYKIEVSLSFTKKVTAFHITFEGAEIYKPEAGNALSPLVIFLIVAGIVSAVLLIAGSGFGIFAYLKRRRQNRKPTIAKPDSKPVGKPKVTVKTIDETKSDEEDDEPEEREQPDKSLKLKTAAYRPVVQHRPDIVKWLKKTFKTNTVETAEGTTDAPLTNYNIPEWIKDKYLDEPRFRTLSAILPMNKGRRRFYLYFGEEACTRVFDSCTEILDQLKPFWKRGKEINDFRKELFEIRRLSANVYLFITGKHEPETLPWSFESIAELGLLTKREIEKGFLFDPPSFDQIRLMRRICREIVASGGREGMTQIPKENFATVKHLIKISREYELARGFGHRGVSSSSRITIHRVFSSLPTISSFFFGTSSWTTRKR